MLQIFGKNIAKSMRSSERAVNNRKRNVNAKALQKQTKGEKIMAFETPKTDWKPESIPTEEDFNRIEKNIAHLNDAVTVGDRKSTRLNSSHP